MPDLDHPDVNPDLIPPEFRNENQGEVVVVDMVNDRAAVRAEGDMVRNRLMENMPPPTVRELRLMQRRD